MVSALGKSCHTHFFQLSYLTGEPAYTRGGYLQPQHFPDNDIKKKTPGVLLIERNFKHPLFPDLNGL